MGLKNPRENYNLSCDTVVSLSREQFTKKIQEQENLGKVWKTTKHH